MRIDGRGYVTGSGAVANTVGRGMSRFDTIFPAGEAQSKRSAYLARLLGIFSEDIVKHWCCLPDAKYENLGRPTLRRPSEPTNSRGTTLDFTLRRREDSVVFVAEQKCLPGWGNGTAFLLTGVTSLERAIKGNG